MSLEKRIHGIEIKDPEYRDYRPGDVMHSRANFDKAKTLLGYEPLYRVDQGLDLSVDWYINDLAK
jgi:UDP-N-acetylglucosamine 4-epimerase